MNNKFFTFIRPLLNSLDSGSFFRKPFGWIYTIFAVLNLLFPILTIVSMVNGGFFDAPIKFILAYFFSWLSLVFAGWVGFQLWWDRRTKLVKSATADNDFIAMPAFAHFIQTLGEWMGIWTAIVGFSVSLFSILFLGQDAYRLSLLMDFPLISSGIYGLIAMPIYGFLIVVVSRFISELYKAIIIIAINTKKDTQQP